MNIKVPLGSIDEAEYSIDIGGYQSADATIVEVTLCKPSGETWRSAMGTAKRCPDDKFNADTGLKIATGRAFLQLAAVLLDEGLS